MKILVLSDTHGDIKKAEEAIRDNEDVDLIIHLGDYFRDAQYLSSKFPKIPIEYIYGNSDFLIEDVPAEKVLEYCGKRIFLTHGHKYSVKWDHSKLEKKAEEMQIDLLLFGHTHIAEVVEKQGRYFINPGSISEPRNNRSESYAIIELNNSEVKTKLLFA